MFRTECVAPFGVSRPFQRPLIVWPPANVQVIVQPAMAVAPLVAVTLAVNPPARRPLTN